MFYKNKFSITTTDKDPLLIQNADIDTNRHENISRNIHITVSILIETIFTSI